MKTEKNRHNMILLETVFSHLTADERNRLTHELPTRIDDDGFFYIRFDKKSLFHNHVEITESGDCFHMKIKLAAFPANPETYMEAATTLISLCEGHESVKHNDS
jgi:RNA binding exosome subunit